MSSEIIFQLVEVHNTYLFNSKYTHAFPKYPRAMFLELTKNIVHRKKTILSNRNAKMSGKNRREVVKWRSRNTSHLIPAIEHRKQTFKTEPEM